MHPEPLGANLKPGPSSSPPDREGIQRLRLPRVSKPTALLMAVVVSALHVVVLSILFGSAHRTYLLVSVTSGIAIWTTVPLIFAHRRWVGIGAGVVLAIIIQQLAFRAWRAELAGFWWSLAQFAALQLLIGLGMGKAVREF